MRSFHSGEPHSLAAKRSQSERTEESCSLSSAKGSSSKRASCGRSSADSSCSTPAISSAGSTAPGSDTPSVSSASGASNGSALGTTPKCSSMRACTSVPMVAAREGRCGTGRNSSCTVPCGSSLRRMNVEAERWPGSCSASTGSVCSARRMSKSASRSQSWARRRRASGTASVGSGAARSAPAASCASSSATAVSTARAARSTASRRLVELMAISRFSSSWRPWRRIASVPSFRSFSERQRQITGRSSGSKGHMAVNTAPRCGFMLS